MKTFQYVTAASPSSARELLGDNGRYISARAKRGRRGGLDPI